MTDRPTNQAGTRPERQCNDDVVAGAHAAVDQHFRPLAHAGSDLLQCEESGQGAVELTATMVGDHHSLCARFNASFGVIGVHDAFDVQRAPPLLTDPGEVVPVHVGRQVG